MRKNVVATLFVILASLNVSAVQAQIYQDNRSTINVEASAEKYVMPDEIIISVVIDEKDFAKKQSLESLEKDMVQALKKTGIDIKKDLKVVDMASDFKQYKLRKSEIKLSKSYKIKVTTATQAMKVMMSLDEVGISQVSIEELKCTKLKEYQDELRVEAMKEAKRRATLLAEAIGQTVGKAVFVRDDSYIPYRPTSRMRRSNEIMLCDVAFAEEEPMPELEFDNYKLQCNVTVNFELK